MAKKQTIKIKGIVYLAHPATTYGTLDQNVKSSVEIQNSLMANYHLSIINPLITINPNISGWDECMEQCEPLLRISTALILSPKWYLSRGCKQEALWAIEWGKDIYTYSVETDKISFITHEEVLQILNARDVYTDNNINIKHDDNLIYINYFGSQYTFSKGKKHIVVPSEDDALKPNISPDNYLEEIGRGLQLYTQLPEEYLDLLSKNMDYSFFFGNQDQLCLKSDQTNESLHLNKYNANVLLQILLFPGSRSKMRVGATEIVITTPTTPGGPTSYHYYVDNKGVSSPLRDYKNVGRVTVYYYPKTKNIAVSKDGLHFMLTALETTYLLRLLEANIPSEMKIR